jgi:hypothetical protein
MNMPCFSAEHSLDQSSRVFQLGWTVDQTSAAIYPAQGSDCFGSVDQCRKNYCDGLTGRQHGLCWNACARPSVCEPSCRWHAEAGSFSRFCYKHLQGPPGASIGCYENCFVRFDGGGRA